MIVSTGTYSFSCYEVGNRSLPAILFLHGFMGRGSDWQRVVEPLQNSFYCIAPDLPGHGNTATHGGSECYTMEAVAEGLYILLAQLGITQCIVVGYSMGGRLALYTTVHYPEFVVGTVLESASPGLRTEEERQARQLHDKQIAMQLSTTPFAEFLEQWYNQPLFMSLKQHTAFERVVQQRRKNTAEGLAMSLRSMGTGIQPPLWEALPHIKQPMLLLAGEYDEKFVRIAEEMKGMCPSAQMHVVEHAGHTIHVENEQVYGEVLKSFLAKALDTDAADKY